MSQFVRGPNSARTVGWLCSFVIVGGLAFAHGGYDDVARGQATVLVLWVVAVGCAFGLLPRCALTPVGWAAVGMLTAFGVWTAVGLVWTESPEATFTEAGRVAGLLGILLLGVSVQGPGVPRAAANGAASAIALVAVVAVGSRLHPGWFPVPESVLTLPGASRRLSYPLGYWNALAALMAAGLPLLLAAAAAGRTAVGRLGAGAALPVAATALVLTLSRGGAAVGVAALVLFLVLTAHRGRAIGLAAMGGTGTLVVVELVFGSEALKAGLRDGSAADPGSAVALVLLLICAAVGAAAALPRLGPRDPSSDDEKAAAGDERHRARTAWIAGGVAAAGVAGAVVLAVAGVLSSAWQDFRQPTIVGSAAFDPSRLGSATGTGRYQFWEAALNAFGTHPFRGIGAGSYEFWWTRNAPFYLPVRNAHSLYLESLAELGLPGLLALLFFALIVVVAVRRAWRAPVAEAAARAGIAAAVAAVAIAAAIDWAWQMTVLPALALILGAPALVSADQSRARTAAERWGFAALAVVAIVAVAIPLATSSLLVESRSDVRTGRLADGMQAARDAGLVEPSASSPRLQEALIEEQRGRWAAAEADARAATKASPTDWRLWLVLARIQWERGHRRGALSSFAHARALNPRSPLLQRSTVTPPDIAP